MSPSEKPDYHALDRLYSIESEERQERRGLETRATASIAAALAAVAFSANAVSDDLSTAGALGVVLLAIGAVLVFLGVFLSTFALIGGSSTTLEVSKALARALSRFNLVAGPIGLTFVIDSDLDRARVDVDEAARAVRLRFGAAGMTAGADVKSVAEGLASASKVLRRLSGSSREPTLTALRFDDAGERETAGTARPTDLSLASGTGLGIREPSDMELALERAEHQALQLRDGNNAGVIVLKASSVLISCGVLVLVAGVVVVLATATPSYFPRKKSPL